MRSKKLMKILFLTVALLLVSVLTLPANTLLAGGPNDNGKGQGAGRGQYQRVTNAQRQAAALAAKKARGGAPIVPNAKLDPLAMPDYFGTIPNYANSPLPVLDATGNVVPGTGMRKFVDTLPGLYVPNGVTPAGNDLGQYLPVAVADTTTYSGSDYYEIALVQYTQKMHADLPPTTLRGYVQVETPANLSVSLHVPLFYPDGVTPILNAQGVQVKGVTKPQYLGPLIVASKDKPVRVKFTNYLPKTAGGDLFIPVDQTVMGAGLGPNNEVTGILLTNGGSGYTSAPTVAISGGGGIGATAVATVLNGSVNTIQMTNPGSGYTSPPSVTFSGGGGSLAAATAQFSPSQQLYSSNRGTLHLHGGVTPWISDGTPHQWTTPSGTNETYPQGVSVVNVPDMPDPGPGSLTFFYTNQQSARLMFYHDHAYGITRLNVYSGEAAGYIVRDSAEQALIANGTIPSAEIPLVIQDKTFVPPTTASTAFPGGQLAAEDPTWDTTKYGGFGNLWFPHVYMPNQNPYNISVTGGINPMGRWDYGLWVWPPFTGLIANGPVPNPLSGTTPLEGPVNPGTPNPSIVPEAFMDTMVVNGTVYPSLTVDPKAYRFRILSVGNDRYLNLSLYVAGQGIVGTLKTTTGTGYTANPSVTVANAPGDSTGHGFSASAVADLVPGSPTFGQVTFTIDSVGNGYTKPPVITVTNAVGDTTGTGATATAVLYNANGASPTEVGMVAAASGTTGTAGYIKPDQLDGRAGGVPDSTTAGPPWYIIGNEGGFLPQVSVVPPTPLGFDYNRRSITVLDVLEKSLMLGPAERADVIVDFSAYAGKTLLLYNDAPAPNPGFDTRYDYYTADPDQTATGGAPPTQPGYGPNTRTIMQIIVNKVKGTPFNLTALQTALPAAYAAMQPPPIVAETVYNAAFPGIATTNTYVAIQDTSISIPTNNAPTPQPIASVTITNPGAGYTSAPNVSFSPAGATATATLASAGSVKLVNVTNGGSGYNNVPKVTFSPPQVGGVTATGTAVVTNKTVTAVTVTNPGYGYTSAPTVTFSGGSGGKGAAATAVLGYPVAKITVTNGGSYTTPPTPTVTIDPPSAGGNFNVTATAFANFVLNVNMVPKAIIENFDLSYGRMNALLGVELPFTNGGNQTSIDYGYVDPPVDPLKGMPASAVQVGVFADGTQIWKITHNGVDTHAIHTHMFDMQVINRAHWDGTNEPPSGYEQGWKDTVLMHPLEDIIIAVRPVVPTIPFKLANSFRALDVTMPLGTTGQFKNIQPGTNNPVTVTNQVTNYGWEYVYHCHLLGHEENDMMHAVPVAVIPDAPTGLTSTVTNTLSWTDNSRNETDWVIQKASASTGPWTTILTVPSITGASTGTTVTVTDLSIVSGFYYQVLASVTVGSQQTGQFTATAVSLPSNSVLIP